MDKIEFGRELDSYIGKIHQSKQRSWNFWTINLFKAKKQEQVQKEEPSPVTVAPLPVEVPILADNKNSAVGEYDEQKKGLFTKIVEWVVVGAPPANDELIEANIRSALAEKELIGDMHELARISIATFRTLPAQKIRLFKESQDYVTFRNILKKNGLSKE